MKKISLLVALLLTITTAYPAIDSRVQCSIDNKELIVYVDAAINHIIQSSKANARSGLHWQKIPAEAKASAVAKTLKVGQITFKFNHYLVTPDNKTGLEIHHLALNSLDDNHDCIIVDRATGNAWIKSFFGSKFTDVHALRVFINELLSSGKINSCKRDDQESTITLEYQGQEYRAVLRHSVQRIGSGDNERSTAKLVTVYPIITCLGNIERDNVPQIIIQQLASLRSISPATGKIRQISGVATTSPQPSEITSSSHSATSENSSISLLMCAAGKPDEQGKSTIDIKKIFELLGDDLEAANTIDVQGNTALHYLAQAADKEYACNIAWIFMSEDIINHQNALHQTALEIALKNKNYNLAQQILFAGGTCQAPQAAKQALQAKNIDGLRILIDHVDIYMPIQQYTMLGYAVSVNNPQLILFLLQHGADPRTLQYKKGSLNNSIDACQDIEPAEFINKFSHTKQDKEKLIALLTDVPPVSKDEKIARWWQYLHEGKYLSAAKLYEPSWSNQRSAQTKETVLEFACKRQAISLVQQLLADGADTLAPTAQGQLLINWLHASDVENKLVLRQVIDQVFQQQVAGIAACIEQIQSNVIPDLTKCTSAQLQYVSPKYHCSILQALSVAHCGGAALQAVLAPLPKESLAPILTYCLKHTTNWQHPDSQRILSTLTAKAKDVQDKDSFDALTNFCMQQTDIAQVSALVQAIATAGANALELKLVEHFVKANPAIAQILIAQLSDRGLALSSQARCTGNKMTLAELLLEHNNVELVDALVQRDAGLNLDGLLAKVTHTRLAAALQQHKDRRAVQSMIDQAGHTPLTLALVRGESCEAINAIITNSPELVHQASAKEKVVPVVYALKNSTSGYQQLRQAGAKIPANAVEQAFAIGCSSQAIAHLLSEQGCLLPLDDMTARRLVAMSSSEPTIPSLLAQKMNEYIAANTAFDQLPAAYSPVIESLWHNAEHTAAAQKFCHAKLARLTQVDQKVAYLISFGQAAIVQLAAYERDRELTAQLVVQLAQQEKNNSVHSITTDTIHQLLELLTLPELFSLSVKNKSLIVAGAPFVEQYLYQRCTESVRTELTQQLQPLVSIDSFIKQIASTHIDLAYTLCERLQDPTFTAKIIAQRLTANGDYERLVELIDEKVATTEIDKDGSTLSHLSLNENADRLLHSCTKIPNSFLKPNKKGIRPIDLAIKRKKEESISALLSNCSFTLQQLMANNQGRSLVEMRTESKAVNAFVATAIESEFSQETNVLQRVAQLSPALIPDAIAYMEKRTIAPTVEDYVALHNAQQVEKFDELLAKYTDSDSMPITFLASLAKQIDLSQKPYLQCRHHQIIIELARSNAMNEQVFDMQKADPVVVTTFPFCVLNKELVDNIKYDAPGKLLAEFINALEIVVAVLPIKKYNRVNAYLAIQEIYRRCLVHTRKNGISIEGETSFLTQLKKIANDKSIRYKVNKITINNRCALLQSTLSWANQIESLLASKSHEEIQQYWNDVLPCRSQEEKSQALVMSFNALCMMLFKLAPEEVHAKLKKLINFRIDLSEPLRDFATFSDVYNMCNYLFLLTPQRGLSNDPDLEKRFVDFCLHVFCKLLATSSREYLAQHAQNLCDFCVMLIDLCPSHGEYILERVAPQVEPYLSHVVQLNKAKFRHLELLMWAFEQHNVSAAKFLITLCPPVSSKNKFLDLDQPSAQQLKPQTIEKLAALDRVVRQKKLLTFMDLFGPLDNYQNFRIPVLAHWQDTLQETSDDLTERLYFESLTNAATGEVFKLDYTASLSRTYNDTQFIIDINSIYKKILTIAAKYNLYDYYPWNEFYLHRNSVPMLYIYIRSILHCRGENFLTKLLSNMTHLLSQQTTIDGLVFDEKEMQQFYMTLAFDLAICEKLFAADNNGTSSWLSIFCKDMQQRVLSQINLENFEQYQTTMAPIGDEIIAQVTEKYPYNGSFVTLTKIYLNTLINELRSYRDRIGAVQRTGINSLNQYPG